MFLGQNPGFKKIGHTNVFHSALPCNLKQSSGHFFPAEYIKQYIYRNSTYIKQD